MRALLDTNVLRELWHERGSSKVRQAVSAFDPESLFVSVICVGEVARGIAELPHGPKRLKLTRFLAELENDYAARILPVTAQIAHRWGEITAQAQRRGRQLGAADGLIAATALLNGLAVITRNVSDFEMTEVETINPWSE